MVYLDCCHAFLDRGDDDDEVEHFRRCKRCNVDIRRPGSVGCEDSHGHVWYCFSCERFHKDHLSFNDSRSFLDHLYRKHDIVNSEQCRLLARLENKAETEAESGGRQLRYVVR